MTPLPGCSGESSDCNNGTLCKRQDKGSMKFLCSSDTPICVFFPSTSRTSIYNSSPKLIFGFLTRISPEAPLFFFILVLHGL